MARYFIKTFGCKVNQVESEDLHEALERRGAQRVANLLEADFAIVNTCTVTGEADRKVRKELRKSARFPNAIAVIVTGCSAALLKDELEVLDEKIQVVPDKKDIATYLSKYSEVVPLVADLENSKVLPAAQKRIRIPIKVQDGCEDFCSYCIVPFARGKCSSVGADEVVSKIKKLADAGTKEVILTGINLGNYSDATLNSRAASLTALLRRIQNETSIHRVRLSSIEPRHISDELLDFYKENNLLCEHFHIPLQSGSDYVLGDMNRSYSADEYRQTIKKIREIKPNTAITTDIIVGYPSESSDDFQQTFELVKEISFSKIHIFRYSSRVGTAAERLKPLHPRTIRQRAQAMQEQAAADETHYYESRVGSEVELVIEELAKDETATGTTREYLRLTLPLSDLASSPNNAQSPQLGDIVTTRL